MVSLDIVDKRIYVLEDAVKRENALAKAEGLRGKAFGGLTRIFSGVKAEDVEVKYVERRFEPFWHILCRTHVEYNRGREYKVELDDFVRKVVVDGVEHEITHKGRLILNGSEHCVEDSEKEVFIDATTGKGGDYARYVKHARKEIQDIEELMAGEDIVVPAKVKASYLTRNLMSEMLKPVKADEITAEEIRVEKLHLYFRPVYAFEYFWKPKGKTATLELDAVTLEVKSSGRVIRQKMRELMSETDLFEVGSDVADIFVPGGGLALRLAKKVIKKH